MTREVLQPPLSDDWDGTPLLVAFFIPLPLPLGLPHGWSTSFVEGDLTPPSVLSPATLHSDPIEDDHGNFVFLQVWRERRTVRISAEPFLAAMNVHDAITSSGANNRPLTGDAGPVFQDSGTVVEAITRLAMSSEGDAGRAVSDAFDRCLEKLNGVLGAYLTSTGDLRIRPVTRVSLFNLLPWATRSFDEAAWSRAGQFTLNLGTSLESAAGELSAEDLAQFEVMLVNVVSDNPFTAMGEWMAAARRACFQQGDFADAVVSAHTALEILFDTVLLMMAWEEQVTSDSAQSWFDESLAKRLRTRYSSRLGGAWNTTIATTVLGRWYQRVALPRHRVVHAGISPDERTAKDAISSCDEAIEFVKARLVLHRNEYPRTTLFLLGIPGLERRAAYNGFIRQFVETLASTEENWLDSYREWLHASIG